MWHCQASSPYNQDDDPTAGAAGNAAPALAVKVHLPPVALIVFFSMQHVQLPMATATAWRSLGDRQYLHLHLHLHDQHP